MFSRFATIMFYTADRKRASLCELFGIIFCALALLNCFFALRSYRCLVILQRSCGTSRPENKASIRKKEPNKTSSSPRYIGLRVMRVGTACDQLGWFITRAYGSTSFSESRESGISGDETENQQQYANITTGQNRDRRYLIRGSILGVGLRHYPAAFRPIHADLSSAGC